MLHLTKGTYSILAQAGALAPLAPSPTLYLIAVAVMAIAHYLAIRHRPRD